MRFAPLTYRIDLAEGLGAAHVFGYAIALPPPWHGLRFCVRCERGQWTVDHYDSGCGFGGPVAAIGASEADLAECERWAFDRTSRVRCAQSLLAYVRHAYTNGSLRPLFERHGYGWCIDEAEHAMAAYWDSLFDDEHKAYLLGIAYGQHATSTHAALRRLPAYCTEPRACGLIT